MTKRQSAFTKPTGGDAPAEQSPEPQGVEQPQATQQAEPEAGSPMLGDELRPLRQQLAEANDRALRAQAELENFRKRSRRELNDELRYADLPLLRDLLPVLDNVDRAIQAAATTRDADALLEGVQMVAKNLEDVLHRRQCIPIEALHEPFDPNRHEAIAMRADPDHPANTVVEVVQPGFQLHDRVVRPAQVIVSTGKPGRAEPAENQ